ncbi:MAG TPA: glycosyltransferase [Ghiorsea sp.]|nr:glycosyltransferase [Ghiorsea sp.]HIP06698.1 glycosyltransferase [Mariprofundaceae bacterium]
MQNNTSASLAIVIPVFNEGKVLPAALKSLQELAVDELIFVDGGSVDNTVSLIQDAGFVCLQSEAGRAKQMNFGTQNTTSDIILYLHIDTTLSSSNILSIKKTYNQGYKSGRFNISLSNKSITYRIISYFINYRSCLTKVSTGDQGIFVTREAFAAVGGYPDIPLMEDVLFTKQLRRIGKVACLKDVLVTSSRRWEEHGVFSTVWLMWKLRFLFWLGVSPSKLAKMYRDAR